MAATKLNHTDLVRGKKCIHIDRFSNALCNKDVRPDGPNGWLCAEHDYVVNQPKISQSKYVN